MKSFYNILLCILFISVNNAFSQLTFWKGTIGGSGIDEIQDVSIDSEGNYWVAGFMGTNLDADPGNGVATLNATAINTPILLKLSPSGVLLNAFQFTNTLLAFGYSVDNDAEGNVYFQGYYLGEIDLDPGLQTNTEVSQGNGFSVFVVKLDNDGNFIWGKSVHTAGTLSGYQCQTMDVNDQGEVVLGGYFKDTLLISSISPTDTELPPVGFTDGIVIRLNSNGDYLWSAQFAYPERDAVTSAVKIDPNNYVFVGVQFTFGLTLYPEEFNLAQTNSFNQDIYCARFMPDGTLDADWTLEGSSFDYLNALELTDNGDILLTGSIQGSMDFDFTAADVILSPGNATDLGFIARYTNQGDLVWAKGFNSDSKSYCHGVVETADGKIHITGQHRQTTDFDPDNSLFNLSTQTPQQTDFDAFYCVLNGDGSFVSALALQGAGNSLGEALASKGTDVILSGFFRNDIDLDPSLGSETVQSQGESDAFLFAFNENNVGLNPLAVNELTVYPNPTKSIASIDLRSLKGEINLSVFNSTGQIIEQIHLQGGVSAPLKQYPPGVYIIEVVCSGAIYKPVRLVVQP